LYKEEVRWFEAASCSLVLKHDDALDARMDEIIRLIGKAQQEDGYVNTFFISRGATVKQELCWYGFGNS